MIDFSDLEFVTLDEEALVASILQHVIRVDATNADLGFGPGDDDEQEAAQHFFSFGRILA